jgi:hypothetical protein
MLPDGLEMHSTERTLINGKPRHVGVGIGKNSGLENIDGKRWPDEELPVYCL